ncbi:tRNA pseudouridine(38-40) synthase TruA [Alkalicoccus daliensis]|uniref:tRNA pseudouridine synthase A n=1 Tax=Alkalicoccus daliensis TaxID=745820 RepID=A0A1H0F8R0_9BACI|nr:tRNA pseudouridine(38-40) synthase TruA [Alkalicoccus daliensis]SDN90985.1 tRNA pseudouridine38-40 synthase [Alkalicoccus daliensis]
MTRILLRISYDGSGFKGYQKQPNARSVQGEVERALAKIHKAPSWPSTSSGRTDAGVHGRRQPVHFDTPLAIPESRWARALNSLLPEDIYVHDAEIVADNFHARYDAVGKEYLYKFTAGAEHDIFARHFRYQLRQVPDQQLMQQAADYMLGTHNFASLSSPKTDVVDKVRTMYAIDVWKEEKEWTLRFIGSGFLYQMVRVMTGTLLDCGFGERNPEDIPALIAAEDRTKASKTAPGHGLYLSQVFYEKALLEQHLTETAGRRKNK